MSLIVAVFRLKTIKKDGLTWLDLSSILFDNKLSSKITYFLLFISSLISVCVSFAKILTWGNKPIVKNFFTIRFLKVIFFILCKLFLHAYILSSTFTAVQFGLAFSIEDEEGQKILEIYWLGLDRDPDIDFTTATVIFPICFILFQFLPSLVYVLFLNSRHSGLTNLYEIFVDNASTIVIAMITNISFYEELPNIRDMQSSSDSDQHGRLSRRAASLPNIDQMFKGKESCGVSYKIIHEKVENDWEILVCYCFLKLHGL